MSKQIKNFKKGRKKKGFFSSKKSERKKNQQTKILFVTQYQEYTIQPQLSNPSQP